MCLTLLRLIQSMLYPDTGIVSKLTQILIQFPWTLSYTHLFHKKCFGETCDYQCGENWRCQSRCYTKSTVYRIRCQNQECPPRYMFEGLFISRFSLSTWSIYSSMGQELLFVSRVRRGELSVWSSLRTTILVPGYSQELLFVCKHNIIKSP